MLLGFIPFLVFAVAAGSFGAVKALALGAAASGALVVRSRLRHEAPKLLEMGTFALLLVLTAYAAVAHQSMSLFGVRVCVDAGLAAIILVSLLIKKPFTLQYARERVAPSLHDSPRFIRTNVVITLAWFFAFVVLTLVEAAIVFVPGFSESLGIVICLVAILSAGSFTFLYPKKVSS